MEALEAIFTRQSIREYSEQAIPEASVQELLSAAMQAPSAGNQQPWHFIVLTDRNIMTSLAKVLRFGQSLLNAPLGIVVCADLKLEKYSGYWVQDCSNATMNLLLASHAMGLGAVWLGVYPVEDRVDNLRKLLGLPDEVIPLSIVSIGFPKAKPGIPERRFKSKRVHANQW